MQPVNLLFSFAGDRVCSVLTGEGTKVWRFISRLGSRALEVDAMGKLEKP